jgi:hypothetical protein
MTELERVAEFVRSRGQDEPVHLREIENVLDINRSNLATLRAKAMREYDDMYPCAPATITYHPGWKEEFPDEWAAAERRSRKAKQTQLAKKVHGGKPETWPIKSAGPNVIGPIITVHNVVAVNIHSDHIAIQHIDGSWTEFKGDIEMKAK